MIYLLKFIINIGGRYMSSILLKKGTVLDYVSNTNEKLDVKIEDLQVSAQCQIQNQHQTIQKL